MSAALPRLQAISRALQPNDPILILPDDVPVHRNGDVLYINHLPVISFTKNEEVKIQHLTSAVRTSYETSASHIPSYPLLTLTAESPDTISIEDFWSCLYALHTLFHSQEMIPMDISSSFSNRYTLEEYAIHTGLARRPKHDVKNSDILLYPRSAFFQGAGTTTFHTRGFLRSQATLVPAISGKNTRISEGMVPYPPCDVYPRVPDFTRTPLSITAHTQRPQRPRPGEVLYKRWCPRIKMVIEFQAVDFGQGRPKGKAPTEPTPHLVAYNKWHNSPYVSRAWHHEGSIEFHRKYLERMYNDEEWLSGGPHNKGVSPENTEKDEPSSGGSPIGLVMLWNGEMMGWIEVTWVKENHMGTYVPDGGARDYDRGIHILVGEQKFTGVKFSKEWMAGLIHLCFLLDPRTDRVLGEPTAHNAAVITLSEISGMHVHGIFDFPYKRSAITYITRDHFFSLDLL